MPPKFTLSSEEELKVVSLYKGGTSIRKIAELYPVGRTSIGYTLKRHNVETKSTGNPYKISKYTLNRKYFTSIDSEDKAYWLGFISADGHVSDDGVTIGLHKKDEAHLEKFLKDIGSNSSIKHQKNASIVSIYSKDLVKDLRGLGFFRNKSETQTFPKIDSKWYPSFLRGLFDGDGTLSKDSISFCGTESTIKDIKFILESKFNLKDSPIRKVGNTLNIISWCKNRISILNYLYEDCPKNLYLERKYVKYLDFKEYYKNSKRMKP